MPPPVQPAMPPMTEEEMYKVAFEMADQSYGTFEECLNELKACQGDKVRAEKTLL